MPDYYSIAFRGVKSLSYNSKHKPPCLHHWDIADQVHDESHDDAGDAATPVTWNKYTYIIYL